MTFRNRRHTNIEPRKADGCNDLFETPIYATIGVITFHGVPVLQVDGEGRDFLEIMGVRVLIVLVVDRVNMLLTRGHHLCIGGILLGNARGVFLGMRFHYV